MELKIIARYETRKSKSSGKDYQLLVLVFPNGYEHEIYDLKRADHFAIGTNFK